MKTQKLRGRVAQAWVETKVQGLALDEGVHKLELPSLGVNAVVTVAADGTVVEVVALPPNLGLTQAERGRLHHAVNGNLESRLLRPLSSDELALVDREKQARDAKAAYRQAIYREVQRQAEERRDGAGTPHPGSRSRLGLLAYLLPNGEPIGLKVSIGLGVAIGLSIVIALL